MGCRWCQVLLLQTGSHEWEACFHRCFWFLICKTISCPERASERGRMRIRDRFIPSLPTLLLFLSIPSEVAHIESIVKLQHTPDNRHLGMVAVILHAMAPDDLALLEQELAADLEDVAALDHVPLADGDFVLAVERGR
jgi:hypothetical protein